MYAACAGTTAVEHGTNGSAPSLPKVADLVGMPSEVGSDDWAKAKLSVVVVGASGMRLSHAAVGVNTHCGPMTRDG